MKFWMKYHKWVGLIFTFFILAFCISGLILNHRDWVTSFEVDRKWLPEHYQYVDWNNGLVKGSLKCKDGTVLLYGNAGIWKTDSTGTFFEALNKGFPQGVDFRKISNMVEMPDGTVWCAGLYSVYRLRGEVWTEVFSDSSHERIADLTAKGDTLVVLSRSHLYWTAGPHYSFSNQIMLKEPVNHKKEVSLFRFVWLLHSGEIIGLLGKLIVDMVAVVLILLCLTGLVYWLFPHLIRFRRHHSMPIAKWTTTFRLSLKWHNRLGAWMIGLTLFVVITGMCLRPPLMIPLVLNQVLPPRGTTLRSDNPFHDKLRCIRWDEATDKWIIVTSDKFYTLASFSAVPSALTNTPPVSPMGVNVFQKYPQDKSVWLVGSFSGLYMWNPSDGEISNYLTGKPICAYRGGRPVSEAAIAGYVSDLNQEMIVDYSKGALRKDGNPVTVKMPVNMQHQPMSLWNFALELHVGRMYYRLLGPLSGLFVFLSGLIFACVLISGYIVYRKRYRHKKKARV